MSVVCFSGRVAIRTKFLSPTNHRGARVKVQRAEGGGQSLTVGWDYSMGVEDNHADAVVQFLDMMDWDGEWTIGAVDGGYVAVRSGGC